MQRPRVLHQTQNPSLFGAHQQDGVYLVSPQLNEHDFWVAPSQVAEDTSAYSCRRPTSMMIEEPDTFALETPHFYGRKIRKNINSIANVTIS